MHARPLRVGLAGFGFSGQTFHAPVIAAVPGMVLAAVATSQPQKALAAWPKVDVLPDAAALVARRDLDLIVVAAPNAQHASIADRALRAGKHVVVDKPFTVNAREARALAALARSAGRMLTVYQNRRFDADFLTVRDVVDSGRLGRLVYFESRFDRYKPGVRERWREQPVPGAGLWLDLGPHLLDQAVQLFGWPSALQLDVAALRDGARVEDHFHALLHYDQGLHAPMRVVLHASTLAAAPAARFVLHGTHGSYVKHGVDPQEDALRSGGRPGTVGWGRDRTDGELSLKGNDDALQKSLLPTRVGDYAAFYAAVRDAVAGEGSPPVTLEEAVDLMELLDLGVRSAQERRALVPSAKA